MLSLSIYLLRVAGPREACRSSAAAAEADTDAFADLI